MMKAVFSNDRMYRYRLDREGPGDGSTAIIMVNPSTADELLDDATIRKVRGFGRAYSLGDLLIGNLFAFRATDITKLRGIKDPIGPENDRHLAAMMMEADRLIFAWGTVNKLPRELRTRWVDVYRMAQKLDKEPLCFTQGDGGFPRHPLMLPYSTPLVPWHV